MAFDPSTAFAAMINAYGSVSRLAVLLPECSMPMIPYGLAERIEAYKSTCFVRFGIRLREPERAVGVWRDHPR